MNEAQIEAVAQANAFLTNAGLPAYVEMFKLYGRLYKVVASFPAADIDQANTFMLGNPETGVLSEKDGRVIIVNLKDKGVPA